MKRLKYITLLLLLPILVLCFVAYVSYFVHTRSEGSFRVEVVAGNRTVEEAYFELPIDDEGPIYRIKEIALTVRTGEHSTVAEPVVNEEINGYITGFYVQLGGKETFVIEGHYVIEDPGIIDYEKYPWELTVDGQTSLMQVTETMSTMGEFLTLVKEDSIYLIPTLTASVTLLGALTTYTWFRGKYFQQKPQSLAVSGECDWCTMCVKFLKVDPESPGGQQLPDSITSKLLDMLEGVNSIWEKCCVKFVPCLKEGKVVAETINPDNEVDVLLDVGYIEPVSEKKITLKIFGRLNARDVLNRDGGKGIVMEGGKVNVKIKQWLDARWEHGISFGGREHKAGDKASPEIVMAVAKSIVNKIQKLIGSGKDGGLRKSKEFFELIHYLAGGREKVVERNMDASKVLEALAKTYGHTDMCLKVFILSKIDDPTTKAKESGWASTPGRAVLIEEKQVELADSFVLAHELGHNLGLQHVTSDGWDNLMNPEINGTKMNDDQCKSANNNCWNDQAKRHDVRICGKAEKMLEFHEAKKQYKKIENNIKSMNKEIEEIRDEVQKLRADICEKQDELKHQEKILKNVAEKAREVRQAVAKAKTEKAKANLTKKLDKAIRSLEKSIASLEEKLNRLTKKPDKNAKEIVKTKRKIEEKQKLADAI